MDPARRFAVAVASLLLALAAPRVGAAPAPCPSSGGISYCAVEAGSAMLEVLATSLDGGAADAVLTVDDEEQLALQAFKIYSFDAAEFIDVVLDSATEDPSTDTIRVQFTEVAGAVRVTGQFSLREEAGATVVDETITFLSQVPTNQSISGRFYVITDFDLRGDPLDDTIAVSQAGARIEQTDRGGSGLWEVLSPAPDDWDVAPCCLFYDLLFDELVPLVNRTTVPGPDDFHAALSWDRVIPGGQSVVLTMRKTVVVPEPASGAGAAALALALVARRRRGGRQRPAADPGARPAGAVFRPAPRVTG